MAESVVTFLLEKLYVLLEDEVSLLGGVHREVRFIADELQSIRAFLREADAREADNDGIKAWVEQVRDVAYNIEDVLDEFAIHLAKRRSRKTCLGKTACFIKSLRPHHEIATQIQNIKVRIQDISERSKRFNFTSDQDRGTKHDPRKDALFIEEDDVVGLDKPKEDLIGLLTEEGEARLRVLSVVGMGGLGKTTLVKKVYDDQRIKECFHCQAWIYVSQSFKPVDLLQKMIAQLFPKDMQPSAQELSAMDDIKLKNDIKNFLKDKRYVIVFDDVWGLDAWNDLKHALPNSTYTSRIIITTRSKDTGASCGHVYDLEPLPQDESLKLFCMKAFHSNNCPSELKELSEIMLQKCEGLPLAIVALGSLLSTKDKTIIEWDTVLRSLSSEQKFSQVKSVLHISYIDLPYYLKSCFLYLSLLPENKIIECIRLIRLWTAEGFIEKKKGLTIEEVAEGYLYELMNRSLIQIVEKNVEGRARTCRVHNLMHAIILSKSKEENFGAIVDESSSPSERSRRLSFHNVEHSPQNVHFPHLRSLMFPAEILSSSSLATCFGGIKLLKILDMRDAKLEELPTEILNLIHLRYLSLRRTKIKTIPNSIAKLQNLETLDLKGTCVSKLPIGILKLKRLRHLLVYRYDMERYAYHGDIQGIEALKGIKNLIALQKLSHIEVDQRSDILKELARLNQLRRLGILKLKTRDGVHLCSSIEKMKQLRTLSVVSVKEEEVLDLQLLNSPPLLLQKLYIEGKMKTLPRWISSLNNLVKLSLRYSKLAGDPLETLQVLQNLVELELFQACDQEVLCFKENGFQKLKKLYLEGIDKLRLIIVEEGAILQLEELDIVKCQSLEKVPIGIEHLSKLKELRFGDMHYEFITSLSPEGGSKGEDHWRIAHVPSVNFTFLSNEGWQWFNLDQLPQFYTLISSVSVCQHQECSSNKH